MGVSQTRQSLGRLVSLCGVILLSVSWVRESLALLPFHITGTAQGTTYSVTFFCEREKIKKPQLDSIFRALDQSLSTYKPSSLISRFNNADTTLVTDEHLFRVVRKSLEIYRDTDGAFDITVLPLMYAWGFGTRKPATFPDSAEISSLLDCVGSDKIRLNGRLLSKTIPCLQMDVNGIAQGYSVDVIAAFLETQGIANYLVEVGGEIRVKGRKYPEDKLMSVGIERPSKKSFENTDIGKIVQMKQGAITTSGNYRQYQVMGSKRISHIVNPKTGYTSQSDIISVTVIAEDAITADGYDNALVVMGLTKSLDFLNKHKNLDAYFIYQKPDGTVSDTASAGFYKYFR
ncbi:FAD:protein FMN transferase [Dyadobacter sp. CECT 9275]|uniref:FAD:protein FMN transferase n=1 Tax=Dyadobacter helix TaxID=2822344 RepID=A0A916NEB6_9BACT|nr:FAD:protein FMN transferase [Dyadobacter sp. CECT 9275]CAG5018625.1 FAD:protein FMN transferase [Dyadobacter sp. CECT 9275]